MKQHEFFIQMTDAWNKRELKERRILLALAVLVLFSLIYLIGVQPALSNIKKLEEYNPKLKQEVAMMSSMADQYAVISKVLSENLTPVTREAVESSLGRRGIKTQSLSVTGDVVRFQANVASYAQLMEWILEMQKAARLSVEDAKLIALTEPGQVSAVMSLRQQRVVQ